MVSQPDRADGRVRVGLLGCAAVADYALIEPARQGADLTIAAVAARDPGRAAAYAAQHDIPEMFDSYASLIARADVDAIYVALPNALHGRWAIAALEAGLPVLCEKPLAANGDEAEAMAYAADRAGLPLVEALHWRDHPVAGRIRTALRSLGALRSMDLRYSLPGDMLPRDNIRFDPALAGGWLMDQGCYCLSLARYVAGEPQAVIAAAAIEERPGIDGGMDATLRFAGGVTGRIAGSMIDPATTAVELSARFVCDLGTLTVHDPYLPGANPFTLEQGARLALRHNDGRLEEERADLISSWLCQANAFARTIRERQPGDLNPAWDAVANMRAIDAIYRAAGMTPRRPA